MSSSIRKVPVSQARGGSEGQSPPRPVDEEGGRKTSEQRSVGPREAELHDYCELREAPLNSFKSSDMRGGFAHIWSSIPQDDDQMCAQTRRRPEKSADFSAAVTPLDLQFGDCESKFVLIWLTTSRK